MPPFLYPKTSASTTTMEKVSTTSRLMLALLRSRLNLARSLRIYAGVAFLKLYFRYWLIGFPLKVLCSFILKAPCPFFNNVRLERRLLIASNINPAPFIILIFGILS